jgi:hypothetical protein
MHVTKGLIIADPWIGHVLHGSKTWEDAVEQDLGTGTVWAYPQGHSCNPGNCNTGRCWTRSDANRDACVLR